MLSDHGLLENIVIELVYLASNKWSCLFQTVLKNFSLHIPGGTMVALVGLSGNGKEFVVNPGLTAATTTNIFSSLGLSLQLCNMKCIMLVL